MCIRAWYPTLFFLFLLQFLMPSLVSAAEVSGEPLEATVEIRVEPAARTTIFNTVILLPLLKADGSADTVLTETVHREIVRTDKYSLLSMDIVDNWFKKQPPLQLGVLQARGIAAGRALRARGVIVGNVTREEVSDSGQDGGDSIKMTTVALQMLDAQNKKEIWTLEISIPLSEEPVSLEAEQLNLWVETGVQRLLDRMVQQGDIFSTQIVKPRILSKQGQIRSVRVVLQPDPPHIHRAYQLLRSKNRDTVFTPAAPPVTNDRGPLILTDKDLEDGTTYYYTIIGINSQGLANIPELPFTISTTGQPKAVGGFQASGSGLRQIQLSWEPPHDPDIDGYVIYRSGEASGPFTQIVTIEDRDQQSYIDRGGAQQYARYGKLDDNTEYFYNITSRNTVGVESEASPVVSATTKGAPLPPENVKATNRQPRSIPLSWDAAASPHVKGYAVFRSEEQEGPYQEIAMIDGWQSLEFVDMGAWNTPLADDSTYYYKIQAVNVVENRSPFSAATSATTKPAPQTVSGIELSSGLFRTIELSWQPNPEADIIRYEIIRGSMEDSVSQKIAIIEAPGKSYTDKGLEDGRTYWYRICAVDRDSLQSELSAAGSGSTKATPSQPQGLQGSVVENGYQLTWQANPEKDIVSYQIHTKGFLASEIGQTDQTSYLVEGDLDPDTVQTFHVRAIDADGLTSPFSDSVTIGPSPEKTDQQ